MKKWIMAANSILVFPFFYVLLGASLSWVADTLHLGGLMDNGVMGFLFGAPMILAYVLLPDAGLILLPVLTAFAAFSMWKIWPERCGFLVGYLLVFLLYDAYLVWWYSTGQKVHLEF